MRQRILRSLYKHWCYQAAELMRALRARVKPPSQDKKQNDNEPFENGYRAKEDPWSYASSPYELVKYRQTLELLPDRPFKHALEIGCAEGLFTAQLAPRVASLMGADISPTALNRARKRCQDASNVSFVQLDVLHDPLQGRFDLIVCSEILYFMGFAGLERVAHKVAGALTDGGFLLMAHMNIFRDDPRAPGFDWNLAFGAKVIGDIFQKTYPLRLVKEMRFPLYRIQLFQRQTPTSYFFGSADPEVTKIRHLPTPLPPELSAQVRWVLPIPSLDFPAV